MLLRNIHYRAYAVTNCTFLNLSKIKQSHYAYWIFGLVYTAPDLPVVHLERNNRLGKGLKILELEQLPKCIAPVHLDNALINN